MVVRGAIDRKIGKTLIVNADQEITRILEIHLTHANLEVISAKTGASALRIVQNNKPDIVILDTALPDMECIEICHKIKELSGDIPIILIGSTHKRKFSALRQEDIIFSYINKPFEPKEVVALVKGYLMHKERALNIDPLTGLPNRIQVHKEIARLIAEKSTFAVIYLTMHDFHAINQYYGYSQGDKIIQLLSDIVSQAVHLFGNPDDLTGHFSGDKFVIVSTPWKARILCRRIISDYNRRIKAMFSEEHLKSGHIRLNSPIVNPVETPVMSIHIAVVTNQKRSFKHHLEVIGYASEQIEYLKRSTESNCYFDLKINGSEPSPATGQRGVTRVNKEEFDVVQSVLSWLDFLHRELEDPLQKMKENLVSLKAYKTENLDQEQRNYIQLLYNNFLHLTQVLEVINNIAKPEGFQTSTAIDEVDVRYVINWVLEQVQPLAEEKDITANVKTTGKIFRILIDKKGLTQALLYIIRNEIRSSEPRKYFKNKNYKQR